MLAAIPDRSLVVEAIWTPVLASDAGVTAAARAKLPDPRVRHWWDRDRWAQRAFRPVLGIPKGTPAWDVYLVYPPGARWTSAAPPAPSAWMHQLRVMGERGRLDGATLRAAVRRALR